MTKKVFILALLLASTSLVACSKNKETNLPEETTSVYGSIRGSNGEETNEAVATNSEAGGDFDSSVEIITDLKGKTSQMLMEQIKSGFNKLNSKVAFSSTTAKDILNGFLAEANLTLDDLNQLSEEELYKKLEKAGMTLDEMYCYSIFNYLIEANEIGDSGSPENYLANTKAVMEKNGCLFDEVLKLRNANELLVYLNGKGITAKNLNAKLYFNSLFPGVNVDATKLLEANTLDELLNTLSDEQLTTEKLQEKADPNKKEAGEFIGKLKELEAEKAKEEQAKKSSGGSSSGNNSKSGATNTVDKGGTNPTIPAGDSNNIVSINIANGDGFGSSSKSKGPTSNYGNTTVTIGDEEVGAKIVVKRIVRGSQAEGIVASSNSNLPGHMPTDLPNGYDMVAVKFTVTLDEARNGVTIPVVKVKNLGGTNIETVATKVFMIQPETEDYTTSTETKTYWVAFKLPDTQGAFALYFGGSGSGSYIFKSSAIEVEGYDKD